MLFRHELDRIAATRGARVHYLLGPDIGPLTSGLFTSLVPEVARRDVFLCGPPGMSKAVRSALLGAGVPERHLHEERFAL